jgi:hypothetical protein
VVRGAHSQRWAAQPEKIIIIKILNCSVFTNFVYASALISDVTTVYHREIIIIMFGDYLIFQNNIVCTFLRRWRQILTAYCPKTVGLQFRLYSISRSFLSLFWGEGRQLYVQPQLRPTDSCFQRLGRINLPVTSIYWGLRPLSACQLTGALGKKINNTRFVGYQMEGAKTIGWKPCLTGYTSGAYVLCH